MRFILAVLLIQWSFGDDELYQSVLEFRKLKKEFKSLTSKEVSRIKDIAARRFINLPDWLEHLKNTNEVKPEAVYYPMPGTWVKWQKTAFGPLEKNISSKKKLKFKDIIKWHDFALSGKLKKDLIINKLKLYDNYGANFKQEWALTDQEIENIKSFKFTNNTASLDWTDLVCKDDLPLLEDGILDPSYNLLKNNPDCQDIYKLSLQFYKTDPLWADAKSSIEKNVLFHEHNPEWAKWFWYACWPRKESIMRQSHFNIWRRIHKSNRLLSRSIATQTKRCGMVHYPHPEKSIELVENLLASVNRYLKSRPKYKILQKRNISEYKQRIKLDLSFAIKVQREFAAIHPFDDGNGRISRFLMDYITAKSDLPTLFIPNMNNDFSAVFEDYYDWTKESISTTNQIIKKCIKNYQNLSKREYQKSACGFLFEYKKI